MFSHKPINQVVLLTLKRGKKNMVEGDGFEPSVVPADLQSAPFDPQEPLRVCLTLHK